MAKHQNMRGMDELLEILKEVNGDIDYSSEKALIDSGLYESYDVINCIVMCEEHFAIEVPPEEMTAENFQSIETIWKMLERIMKK